MTICDRLPTGATRWHRFAVAPMMDWTDRHCRVFHRLLTRHGLLYTEMVTAQAVAHGDRDRLLGFDPGLEGPVALQIGGSEPNAMARAAEIGAAYGYDEININVGCPSDRVQKGRFGACLMAEPDTVAACFQAMDRAVGGQVPITVKCRIGIDDQDEDADLNRFVGRLAEAGCRTVIVHARKAWLDGLSPKENRDVPPLNYPRVHRLKRAWGTGLTVVINGGLTDWPAIEGQMAHVDGVMLGRAAYHAPWLVSEADRRLFGAQAPGPDRAQVAEAMARYADRAATYGVPCHAVTRHMLGLFHGQPGGRLWRRHIAENAPKAGSVPGAAGRVILDALDRVREASAKRRLAA